MTDNKSIWVAYFYNELFHYTTKFFSTEEGAKACLRKIANERRYKPGVDILVDTDIEFSYLFGGWDARKVSFKIREIPLDVEE
jgi:hypothetical protein